MMRPDPALLETKLYLPRARGNWIARPRLTRCLDAARSSGASLILVAAPAGFGKTTTVGEWCHAQSVPCVWLALDEADNDPTRFWTCFIAALQIAVPDLGAAALALLHASKPPPPDAFLTLLVNELGACAGQHVLVLDDYYNITTAAIHHALAFLIEHLPPSLQLVIATRSDPALPLARWRVRGQLYELRAHDLRFTHQEAAEFLNRATGLTLAPSQIVALEERTEGWIAGLQLAALSLRGADDADGFIRAFTGSHRYVMDYLVDEVLARQSDAVQKFLLRTAVLARFNAALCDAVLQTDASAEMLAEIERANLFLIPLDNTREWFRYHHLLAELLRHRLNKMDATAVAVLHRRASEWLEQNGFIQEAIEHAFSANDFARAAALVETYQATFLKRGEIVTMTQWLDALPADVVQTNPRLLIVRARTFLAMNRIEECEQLLTRATDVLERALADPSAQRPLRGEIATLRITTCLYRNDHPAAALWAARALDDLPPEHVRERGEATFWYGVYYVWNHEYTRAIEYYYAAARLFAQAEDYANQLFALVNIGATQVEQGKLRRAAKTFEQAAVLAEEQHLWNTIYAAGLYVAQTELFYEWNDLERAAECARKGLAAAELLNAPRGIAQLLGHLAQVVYVMGDYAETDALLAKFRAVAHDRAIPLHYSMTGHVVQLHIWLQENRPDAAVEWLESNRHLFDLSPAGARVWLEWVEANVLLARGEFDAADRLLCQLHEKAAQAGRVSLWIPVLVLEAALAHARGERATARDHLERALALGAPDGFVRSFVDGGAVIRDLLVDVRRTLETRARDDRQANPHRLAYLEKILGAFPGGCAPPHALRADALTKRELQVLQLIAQGKSNQEIADALFLSLSTIKKHSGLIFQKLDVHNRTEAVMRAREFGLL